MAFVGSLSGSGGPSNTINVTGSMIIANPGGVGGSFPIGFPGTDTVFFVSGAIDGKSAGSRTVSVFGGDVVASGSITIGTGSIRIDSNEISFKGGIAKIISGSGGLTFFDSGNAGGVTLATLATGGAPTSPAGADTQVQFNDSGAFGADGDFTFTKVTNTLAVPNASVTAVTASSVIAGTATVDLFNTTATNVSAFGAATSLTIGGTTGGTTVRNNLTVSGDLTVNGTTTTVNTENLHVEDPLIYFGSGSVGSNRDGGIALASGSSVTNESLVWGRVANDTWGAGRLDVVSGTLTNLTSMTLLPIRSSKLELGGNKSFVTSSNDNLLLNSDTATTFASASVPTFKIGTVDPDGAFPDPAVPAIFGMGGTLAAPVISSLWISGSRVDLAHSLESVTSGVGIVGGDVQGGLLRITKSGVTPTFNVEARDGSGAARALVMTGSTITIGANTSATGITFASATTAIANLSAASSTTPSFVASQTNATFKVGTGGGTTDTLIVSGSTVEHKATIAHKFNLDATLVAHVTASNQRQGFFPGQDRMFDLGGPTLRWANMYTGDLHLRNERGDWTVIEEEDFLTLTNNKSGKRYKFVLEEI